METELIARLQKMENEVFALRLVVAQLAAYLPAPHALLQHLPRDLETENLYSKHTDEQGQARAQCLGELIGLALALRRDMARIDIQQIDQLLPPQ